jgi:hypothetical protein
MNENIYTRIEKDLPMVSDETALRMSIAVSLRRIADALEKLPSDLIHVGRAT